MLTKCTPRFSRSQIADHLHSQAPVTLITEKLGRRLGTRLFMWVMDDNFGVNFERTKRPEEWPEQLLFQDEN